MKAFLTAEWNHLVNITYAVAPELLLPYLPKGLSLDLIDGKAFVSFVAFEFNNVRVKGIKIPFHMSFPEINLRFYVNNKGRRGVVFIKEFVPKFFVALVADKLYNEPYTAIPMNVRTSISASEIKTEHRFKYHGHTYAAAVTAGAKGHTPADHTLEHFFKEHEIGFGKNKKGAALEYRVEHPVWEIYPVKEYSLDVDFGKIYGQQWEFLNREKPYNVLLAKGSDIIVFDKTSI